ncbi:DUF1311 domain-containing protein [Solitalea sp. MAHUQ-68]|uniref:DUF1311 domain-containing protein n=2 Tax=Sphingobacteriaceae TaxID=84566 RepID=A0A9X2F251_9SPHI|nr:lysozyme inhibitor LprI family protein [Solitalea agri]MCO4292715.1 DUF1311 domain-containing protein [Solitalea agri]
MNEKAAREYQKTDKELNIVYQKILKEYSEDIVFVKNLKTAQRIWVQFRDAEMLAKYPDRDEGYYGSMQPMCWNMYKTELTLDRIKKLKIWLAGIEDGDGCSGSVKIKN